MLRPCRVWQLQVRRAVTVVENRTFTAARIHDALLTRLSNDDDMEKSLSTFANEMTSSAMILGISPRCIALSGTQHVYTRNHHSGFFDSHRWSRAWHFATRRCWYFTCHSGSSNQAESEQLNDSFLWLFSFDSLISQPYVFFATWVIRYTAQHLLSMPTRHFNELTTTLSCQPSIVK